MVQEILMLGEKEDIELIGREDCELALSLAKEYWAEKDQEVSGEEISDDE